MEKRESWVYTLEMAKEEEFTPSKEFFNHIEIKEIKPNAFINWSLFCAVGLPWKWNSRLKWSLAEWEKYFALGNCTTFLAFSGKTIVGYFELENNKEKQTEIKFVGLLPNEIGKKHGSALFSHAINQAWKSGAKSVWLHTCSNDHEFALNSYIKRGFKLIGKEIDKEMTPTKEDLLKQSPKFLHSYINHYL
jgi:N-acetylglutamate synthase-like GNAT family acetyltransferase